MYKVYILRTSKNTLYTGISNNLKRRITEHQSKSKRSSKYIKSFDSFELVYTETQPDLSNALKREIEIKKLTKIKKESLIKLYGLLERNELL